MTMSLEIDSCSGPQIDDPMTFLVAKHETVGLEIKGTKDSLWGQKMLCFYFLTPISWLESFIYFHCFLFDSLFLLQNTREYMMSCDGERAGWGQYIRTTNIYMTWCKDRSAKPIFFTTCLSPSLLRLSKDKLRLSEVRPSFLSSCWFFCLLYICKVL